MKLSYMKTLAKDVRIAAVEIDAQPDDREWTIDELDALEEIRFNAIQLASNVEALLGELEGTQSGSSWEEYKHRTGK